MSSVTVTGLTDVSYDSANATIEDSGVYGYTTVYTWRVDSVNEFGTTTGDSWTLTTLTFDPPSPIYWYDTGAYYYRLLPQADGTWGDPPPTGTVDVDYTVVTELNMALTKKLLVAAAGDCLYYVEV